MTRKLKSETSSQKIDVSADIIFESLTLQSDFIILDLKGLVKLQKNFFQLILIEKPVMRETKCQKPHQKIQNSYQVMKVSKFN